MTTAGVVILGGGHGGAQAAVSLRSEGYDGPITMVSGETDIPYQRPPLSKAYLKSPDQQLQELKPRAFYDDQGVALRLGVMAEGIDRHARRVALADGTLLPFDWLVIATGTRPRVPPIAGTKLDGVFYLRTAADARFLRDRLDGAASVVIVGGGFIGLEIAATARAFGKAVTVLEAADRLMGRAVVPEVSEHFRLLHEGWGTSVHLNTPAGAIVGEGGRVAAVEAGGRRIEADLVVVGIGAVADFGMAEAAGLTVSDGIVVDDFMQTSDERILAVGDVTRFRHAPSGRMLRLESVQNAVDQAKVAARTIVGRRQPYRDTPWFWSDQGDAKLQMVGIADAVTRRVVRGRPDDGAFSVFQFAGERLLAIDSVNSPSDHVLGRKIIGLPRSPSPDEIADPSTDIRALAKSLTA